MKELDKLIFLLTLSFFIVRLHAQNSDIRIQEQFISHSELNVYEKLFAHTDKAFYLAGEIIWFKLYNVDGAFHKPGNLSKVAYVEVLDKDLKPVLQEKILLDSGTGNGSFYLPISLHSGVYKFRAYTQWMKNFNADYYFEKNVTIVNSLKNLDEQPVSKRSYEVSFFPEGGSLVENIESKIAFRVTDQWGKGISCEAVVVNQRNDTVAKFQPLKFGIGHFNLTPSTGQIYKAIISVEDTVVIQPLPDIHQQGYAMKLTEQDETKLRVTVRTNISTASGVHLFVHTRQVIKISEQKPLSNGAAEFIIEKNKLGGGISHFTVFSNEGQPICERLYFIRSTEKLIIEPTTTNQQFDARSKVNIAVATKDELNRNLPAVMSASVYKVQSNEFEESSITNYFWLQSELRGKVESPGYYFSSPTAEVDQALDNLMLTHGWRKFLWPDILNKLSLSKRTVPELTGHIIKGKITHTRTGLPARDVIAYLAVPGTRVQLYSSESDVDGQIRFYTNNFYGSNEVLLQTDKGDSAYTIDLINPFSNAISSTPSPRFEISSELKDPLVENSISVQVQNAFLSDTLKQLYKPAVDSIAFYGKPDNLYMLDDYVRFSTMEEVLREYIVEVLVRRQKEDFRLMIANSKGELMLEDPLTLFNGVPVFETNKIMQYDPLKIKKIEVINARYYYGPSILNGIVNFTTYQPDPAMLSGLNAVVFDYEGLQFTREFYSPVYETAEQLSSRMPDFRNVLYWSADVKTGGNGQSNFEFYTSDQKGRYIVVLQGMSAEGRFGQQTISFDVK